MPENSQQSRIHRLSVSDYHRMAEAGIIDRDDKVELINGEIIDMTPIGSPHAGCVNYLQAMLGSACSGQAITSVQNPVTLGENSEPEPDLALLRKRDDWYAASHPAPDDVLLLIEVSDSTLQFDLEVKVPLYASHAIHEVWVVDLKHRQLLQFRNPEADRYTDTAVCENLNLVSIGLLPATTLNLQHLFQYQ